MLDSNMPPSGRPLARRRLLLALGFLAAVGFWSWARHRQVVAPPNRQALPATASVEVNVYAGGRPAAGATVRLLGEHEALRTASADPNGDARLLDCPSGRFVLVVELPGFARGAALLELKRAPVRSQFDLQPGTSVSGLILDESERPVGGVEVLARRLGPSPADPAGPWSARSGTDGRFVIDTLPSGIHINLDIGGDDDHEASAVPELQPPTLPVTVVLRRTAAMTGRTVGLDEKPVPSARVTLAGSGVWPPRSVVTDAAGEFRFERIPEGIYELRGELGDAVAAPLEGIVIGPGNRARVELVLSPGLRLLGHVRDVATGEPLAAAEVEVTEESLSATPKRQKSDASGAFTVRGLRGLPQRVRVRAAGYVALERWQTPGEAAFEAELLREAIVSGSVEDSGGRPVANADLEVRGRSVTGAIVRMAGPINEAEPADRLPETAGDNLGVTAGPVPRVPLGVVNTMPGANTDLSGPASSAGFHSDAQGNFRLEGLPAGELVVSAFKLGYAPGHSRPLRVLPGSSSSEVRIILSSGVTLRGQVVDRYRAPCPHVRVELTAQDGPARSTVTAEDGSFEFEGVRGNCSVAARPAAGPSVKVDVPAAELDRHEVRLVLEQTSERLFGRVLDARQRPIEAASVHLATAGQSFTTSAVSNQDGSFEFERLPAPPYDVRVEHPEYAPSAPLNVLTPGKPLQVQLEAGADLVGRVVTDNSNQVIAAARVSVSAGDVQRSARSTRDGGFEFRHLPLGSFTLRVEADGYLAETRSGALQLTAAGSPRFEQIALARVGGASGDVVDRLGATVWNAEVAAGDPPDWTHAVRTNHAGQFQLTPLRAGEHMLTARSGALSVATREPVRVYEAQITPSVVLRLPGVAEPSEAPSTRARPGAKSADPSAAGPAIVFATRGDSVLIEHVAAGSDAARCGLQAGDVLLSANGEPVRSAAQARGMLARIPGIETAWTLEVRRGGALQRLRYATR